MEIRFARAEDIETIRSLLAASSLSAVDVTKASLITFFVAEDDTPMITGCIGLQEHGAVGLLRSLAVRPNARGAGIGRALIAMVEEFSALRRVECLYLLTTTADDFFTRYGYRAIERGAAPDAIRGTMQYTELCPASATFMTKTL